MLNKLLVLQEEKINNAICEVKAFKLENAWLSEVHDFVKEWNDDQITKWEDRPSDIEELIKRIDGWEMRIANMPVSIMSSCKLVSVDCRPLSGSLLPKLNSIKQQLYKRVIEQQNKLCGMLVTTLIDWVKVLKQQQSEDISEFMAYAQQLQTSKDQRVSLLNIKEHTENLMEVMDSCQLESSTKIAEDRKTVGDQWDAFLLALQTGTEYVSTKAPLMLERVQRVYQTAQADLDAVVKEMESSWYSDPSSDSTAVLKSIEQLKATCLSVLKQMDESNQFHAVLAGESCNLIPVKDVFQQISARREMWHCYKLVSSSLSKWQQTPYNEMNIGKAVSQLAEWHKEVVSNLQLKISASDRVLVKLSQILSSLVKPFSLLQTIMSSNLKSVHWQALSVALALDIDESSSLLIGNLLDADLTKHADMIESICLEAATAFAFEQSLNKIKKNWEEREFHIAKHVSLSDTMRYAKQHGHDSFSLLPDAFVLVQVESLRDQLEDNVMTLQLIVSSPHATEELKAQAHMWLGILQDVARLLDMLMSCQNKWLYLRILMSKPHVKKYLHGVEQGLLKSVDSQFHDTMIHLIDSPRVLNAIGRKKVGWMWIADESANWIVSRVSSCIADQERLLSELGSHVDSLCEQFPRLYFLDQESIVQLSAASQSPRLLLPFINSVYRNIHSIDIVESVAADAVTGEGNVLEITHILGAAGERVALQTPVPTNEEAHMCLSQLGDSVCNALREQLERCCAEWPEPMDKASLGQWVGTFPSQCVLVAFAIHCTDQITRLFKSISKQQGDKNTRKWIEVLLDCCIVLLNGKHENNWHHSFSIVLEGLAVMGIHMRDVIDDLLCPNVTESSYKWGQQFQHHLVPSALGSPDTKLKYKIQIMDHELSYGYEYMGPYQRLVMTPLTERCCHSLALAASSFRCGGIMGSSTTGKTSLIQELSYMVACPCISLLCSSDLPLSCLCRLFFGAIQCGGWLVFSRLHQLQSSLLAGLGQLIGTACSAMSAMFGDKLVSNKRLKCASVASFLSANSPRSNLTKCVNFHTECNVSDSWETLNADLEYQLDGSVVSGTEIRKFDGSIIFQGRLLKANLGFACFVSDNPSRLAINKLPDFMRDVLRVVSLPLPDEDTIFFVHLWMGGFSDPHTLAKKLSVLCKEIADSFPQSRIDLRWVMAALRLATALKRKQYTKSREFLDDNELLQNSIMQIVQPTLTEVECASLAKLVNSSFPASAPIAAQKDDEIVQLRLEVKEELNRNKLQVTDYLIDKIIHLFSSLQRNGGTILLGPCGAGKTTCHKILSLVLNRLYATTNTETAMLGKKKSQNQFENRTKPSRSVSINSNSTNCNFPRVDVTTLFPGAMEPAEIFGAEDPVTHCWKDSLFCHLLREASHSRQQDSSSQRWLVFDGPMPSTYTERLGRMSDQSIPLWLANREQMYMPESVKLIAVLSSIDHFSPALSRFGLVWIDGSVVSWKFVYHSWVDSCCTKWDARVVRLLSSLCCYIIEPTLAFISKCLPLSARESSDCDVHSVTSFTKFVTALFDSHLLGKRQRDYILGLSDDSLATVIAGLFAVAYVWAFGSILQHDDAVKFDSFARDMLAHCPTEVYFPQFGTVFDHQFDIETSRFVSWPEKSFDRSFLTAIPEASRYVSWLEMLLTSGENVLLLGQSGDGISSLVEMIQSDQVLGSLSVIPSMTVQQLRSLLLAKLGSAQRRHMVTQNTQSSHHRRHVVFVDDYSVQVSTDNDHTDLGEVIRQSICSSTILDVERLALKTAAGVQFIVAAYPPSSTCDANNRRFVRPQLQRLFCVLNVVPYQTQALSQILVPRFMQWLQRYPSLMDHVLLARAFSLASIRVHDTVRVSFPWSQDRPHYVWTKHCLIRLAENLLLLDDRSQSTLRQIETPQLQSRRSGLSPMRDLRRSSLSRINRTRRHSSSSDARESSQAKILIHFWYHEISRIYTDRLVTSEEVSQFQQSVKHILKEIFSTQSSSSLSPSHASGSFGFISLHDVISISQGFMQSAFAPDLSVTPSDRQAITYNEQSMTDIMKKCQDALERYNTVKKDSQRLDIILFSEAVEHVIRLCRALMLPCGHAILVSHCASGRWSIAKLASYCVGYKAVDVTGIQSGRDQIKDACRIAGVEKQECVVILSSSVSAHFLLEAYCLMHYGYFEGLFTNDEVLLLTTDPVMMRSRTKADSALKIARFWENVKEHLHVIVCLQLDEGVAKWIENVPKLLSVASTVDFYCAWSKEALTQVAHTYLQQSFKDAMPWSDQITSLLNISEFLAHIHSCVVDEIIPAKAMKPIFTPQTFIEFIDVFIAITCHLHDQQTDTLATLQQVLSKAGDVHLLSKSVTQNLFELRERFSQAEFYHQECSHLVDAVQLQLDEQFENYRNQERRLANEKNNVEVLKNEGQMKYDEVTPLYTAALASLQALAKCHIDELKTYVAPPQAVRDVCQAVCLLFGLESGSWEEAKMLFSTEGFFNNLVYFDKNQISAHRLRDLKKLTQRPSFDLDTLCCVSKAAEALCKWVKAVEMYATIYRAIEPLRQKVVKAEMKVAEIEADLIDIQKNLMETQKNWRKLNEDKKNASQSMAKLSKSIEATEHSLQQVQQLLVSLKDEQAAWLTKMKQSRADITTCPGSAALTAATVVYLGWLPLAERTVWLEKWTKFATIRGRSQNIPVNRDLSLRRLVADDKELVLWERNRYPTDLESVETGLILRASLKYDKRYWPLIIDVHKRARDWITMILRKNKKEEVPPMVPADSDKLLETVAAAKEKGELVIVTDVERIPSTNILSLTCRQHGSCHSNFQICFIASSPLTELQKLDWQVDGTCIICLSTSRTTLTERLLLATADLDWPERRVQEEVLLRELVHHKEEFQEAENCVMAMVARSDNDLMESRVLIQEAVLQCTEKCLESQNHIDTTKQLLEEKELRLREYTPIASRMACLYRGLKRLAKVLPIYSCTLPEFINIYSEIAFFGNNQKTNSWTRRSQIQELVTSVGRTVYARLAQRLLEEHSLILSLLVTLEMLIGNEQISHHDIDLFFASSTVTTPISDMKRPDWITEEQWCALHFVEHHSALLGLCSELVTHSRQWEEYFELDPILLNPEPWMSQTNFSPCHCLALWSILKPERLACACHQFVVDYLGPDFMEPPKQDLSSFLAKQSTQLFLLIHRDEETAKTVEQVSRICSSLSPKRALRKVIVADETGVDFAVHVIQRNRQDRQWALLLNLCLWNGQWPQRLISTIMERLNDEANNKYFRMFVMVKYSSQLPPCLRSYSIGMIACSQSVTQIDMDVRQFLNQYSFGQVQYDSLYNRVSLMGLTVKVSLK
jgi:hypothetical protein